jgi:hypothetical protein
MTDQLPQQHSVFRLSDGSHPPDAIPYAAAFGDVEAACDR